MRFANYVVLVSACSVLACSVLACSANDSSFENAASRKQSIYYGTPDTTHNAVVALDADGAGCTGTIMAVRGSDGYVITAAHCLVDYWGYPLSSNRVKVKTGPDSLHPTAKYSATSLKIHPQYNDNKITLGYDFGLVRFSGASADTPFIQAITAVEDNLVVGDLIDFVGYGVTEVNEFNMLRNHIVKDITELSDQWIVNDQLSTSGGTCLGDSGGPGLTVGTERVASITSWGTSCTTNGYNARVSTVFDSFIKPFVFDANCGFGLNDIACDTCSASRCCAYEQACADNEDCSECVKSPEPLVECASNVQLSQWKECLDTNCENPCNPTAYGCGLTSSNSECQTFFEENCCTEVWTCSADETCIICNESDDPAESCGWNAPYTAYSACLAENCATECNPPESACGNGECDVDGGAGGNCSDADAGSGGTSGGTGGDDGHDAGSAGFGESGAGGGTAGSGGLDGNGGENSIIPPSNHIGTYRVGGGCSMNSAASDSAQWILLGLAFAFVGLQRKKAVLHKPINESNRFIVATKCTQD